MSPRERAQFLRQANALAGCLTGAGLMVLTWYVPAVLFLAMGLAHLLAEIRRVPYNLRESAWMGVGLLLNLYTMTVVLKAAWIQLVH